MAGKREGCSAADGKQKLKLLKECNRVKERKELRMYLTSKKLNRIEKNQLDQFQKASGLPLPSAYREFLETFGIGTYGGALCISFPDTEVLKEFVSYGFWLHENAPITQEELGECVVLGNSIDGDFLAIHPKVTGLILLPRHDEYIKVFPFKATAFLTVLDEVFVHLYQDNAIAYFEPANGGKHKFMHLPEKKLPDLAQRFKSAFSSDFLIENQFVCIVFLLPMGGYVRFNYAIGSEVAIFYDEEELGFAEDVIAFFSANGCV